MNCEDGQEQGLLEAHDGLLDEQFVMVALEIAEQIEQDGHMDAAQRLVRLVEQIAEAKGFAMEVEALAEGIKGEVAEDTKFLQAVLQAIPSNHQDDREALYLLLEANTEKITMQFARLIKTWANSRILEYPEATDSVVGLVGNFCIYLREFPLGNRRENIEVCIACYQILIDVWTEAECPELWARTHANLATTFSERIQGNRLDNMEQAIACHQNALKVFTEASSPVDWATTQNNLANAFKNRVKGDRSDNLEQAITCYQNAFKVRTEANFPADWAMTQNNIASTFLERIKGDRSDNLEQAITHCQNALKVRTQACSAADWAQTQNNLANAFLERIKGGRSENLEQAIACYQNALKIYTEDSFPSDWAMTQNNLGNAFKERILGDRSANLEQAIACYQEALKVYTKTNSPIRWATAQNNLGNAFRERIQGDRYTNLEAAIACYQSSLQVRTKTNSPVDWAQTQSNLGNAFSESIQGERSVNLEQAIACYGDALEIYAEASFPVRWAMTQNNRAAVFVDRIQGDRSTNIERAIACYQDALKVYTKTSFPIQWAATQNNLAIALLERIKGDRSASIEAAIFCYQNALKVRTEADFPLDWASTQNNLGNALLIRIQGERSTNLEDAVAAFRASSTIYRVETDPHSCLKINRNLGNLYFTSSQWTQAVETFELALAANDQLSIWASDDDRRQELKEAVISTYDKLIQSHIHLNQLDKALETVERSRSQRLVNLMATNDLYQNGQIPDEIQTYLQQIDQYQQQIDGLRGLTLTTASLSDDHRSRASRDRNAAGPDSDAIAALEKQKQDTLRQLSHRDPETAALRQVSAPNLAAMQQLLKHPKTALLSFYITDEATYIFILKPDQTVACHTCPDQSYGKLNGWLINEWLVLYSEANATEDESDRKQKYAKWADSMPKLLNELAQRLNFNQLITNHLSDSEELILVPHLFLHQIPFAALPLGDESEEKLLGDRFRLRVVPSTQILEFCQNRAEITDPIYSTVEDATDDLPCANYEGQKIAQLHNIPDPQRLRGRQQATTANYRTLIQNTSHLLSSHHAQSRLDNPLESAILLANGSITLGQLLTPGWKLPGLSDVFLSCCETGVGFKPSVADEPLSLATGFLCAGARSVVSTLWSVDDLATALFSIRYYHHRASQPGKPALSRPAALQQAQQDLRSMTGKQLKQQYSDELNTLLEDRYDQAEANRAHIAQQLQTGRFTQDRYNALKKEQDNWALTATKIDATQDRLKKLCKAKADQPFAHPVYWVGFVSQGVS